MLTYGRRVLLLGALLATALPAAAQVPGVQIKADPSSISEAGGTSTVSVTYDYASTTGWFSYSLEGSTATKDVDFSMSLFQSLDDDDTASTTITALEDAIVDPGEKINITFSYTATFQGVEVSTLELGTVAVTIEDNDSYPTPTLSLSASSIDDGGSATVTADLDPASGAATTLTVSASGPSGTYTLSNNKRLTIAKGSTDSTGEVTITGACPTPGDKTITVSATATNSEGLSGNPEDVTLTVVCPPPTPTLSLSASSIDDGGSATVTADLNFASGAATTLTVSASGPSGTYTLSNNKRLTIAKGSTDSTGEVTITGACPTPGDKTITVSATATNSEGLSGNPEDVTLTVVCPPPTPTLSLSASSIDDGGSATVTADLNFASGAATTLTVSASGPSGTYTLSNNKRLTIAKGSTDSTGEVTITGACPTPGDKTITVSATATNSEGLSGNPEDVTLTVVCPPPTPTLSLSASSIDDGGSATVTADLNFASGAATTLTVSASGPSGTYTLSNNKRLTIAKGSTDSTGEVTITGACPTPGDKTITVSATATNSEGLSGNPEDVTLTVVCPPPTPTLSLSASSIDDGGSATVTADLNFASGAATTLTVSASGPSGTYTLSNNKRLTIAKGSTDSTGEVTITGACPTPGDKTITVSAAATNSEGLSGNPQNLTLTIRCPYPTPTLSLSASSIDDGGSATVTADLNFASGAATRLTVSASGPSGTYTLSNNKRLTIAKGSTDSTGEVTITGACPTPGDKTITVSATATNSEGLSGNPQDLTLTVVCPLDTTAPMYWESSVNGSSLVLTYDETLSTSLPDTVAFTVAASRSSIDVSAVSISGRQVTLTLSPAVQHGETVSVSYTVSSAGSNPVKDVLGNRAVSLTNEAVINNTPAPKVAVSFDASDYQATEGGSAATVTVRLSARPERQVVIPIVAAGGGGATSGDYKLSASSVTFSATQTSRTFTVTATDDTDDDDGERVDLSFGTLPTGVTAGSVSTERVDLIDDDASPTVTLALSPDSIGESGSVSTVTATLSHASSAATTVTVSATPVSPAVAGDFAQSGTRLTIAAGSTSSTGSVTITANDNDLDAVDREVTVSATASNTQGVAGDPASLTLTIEDDDDPPTVSLSSSTEAVGEGAGSVSLTVSLSAASGKEVTVDYATADGTAASGSDYTAASGTLTFSAGDTSKTLTVSITDDSVDEPNETFTVSLSSPSNATLGSTDSSTVTIEDDDAASARVDLSVSPASIREDAGATTMRVTGTLDAGARTDSTGVSVSVGGQAATLTIAAEQTSGYVDVSFTPANNTLDEPDRSVSVTGSAAGLTVTGTSFTVEDDDDPPTVSLSSSTEAVGEGAGSASLTVSLSAASGKEVTVDYATADGTAASGSDYTAASGTLTFSAGDTSKTLTVSITDDSVDESNETFTVGLSSPSNATLGSTDSSTVTIEDDDAASARVDLSISPASIREDAGATTMRVTGTLDAAARTDSTSVSVSVGGQAATLTIAAEQTSGYVDVSFTPANNTLDEPDRSVSVTGSAAGLTVTDTSFTVEDDDDPPTVSLSSSTEAVGEGAGSVSLTVSLSAASGKEVTVDYATADGTAASGSDYTADSDTLTFSAGDMSKTLTVSITDDSVDESNETFTVSLSSPSNAALGSTDSSTVTIEDDDASPTVTLALSPDSIGEDGGVSTVTASLSHASSAATAVTVSATPVSPAVAGDFTQSGTTLTIAAGDTSSTGTVTLTAVNNAVHAPDKSVTVSATASNTQGVAADPADVTLTIEEDDSSVSVSFSAATYEAAEGGSAADVTVSLSAAPGREVVIPIAAAAQGGATAQGETGADYSGIPANVTFAATDMSKSFTVTAADDDIDDDGESVALSFGALPEGVAAGSRATASVTLADDDVRGVTVSVSDLSLYEGGSDTYTVVLTSQPTADVTVDLAVAAGVAEVDVSATPGQLTFKAEDWEKAQTVTVEARSDSDAGSGQARVTHDVDGGDYGSHSVTAADVTVWVNDDDVTVSFSAATYEATEGGSAADVTVSLNAAPGREVVVPIQSVAQGGATAPGAPGADYSGIPASVTFAAADTSKSFAVTAADDDIDENGESVGLSFGTLPKGVSASGQTASTVNLKDPAKPASTALALSVNPESVNESAGAATVTVTGALDGAALTQDAVVSLSVSPGAGTEVADYAASSSPLTITAGQTSGEATITLTPADDKIVESAETVVVGGTMTVGGAATSLTLTPANVTITDDDVPAWSVTVSPASIGEADGSATVTVSTGGVTYEDNETVGLAFSGAATAGTDFSVSADGVALSSPYSLTLAAGSSTVTATLTALADAVSDPDEAVTITASHDGAQIGTAALTVTEGVCGRTEAVRDAIVAAASGVSACADVTAAHLAGITALDFSTGSLTAITLQSGDFDGLRGLEDLIFKGIALSALPSDVFDGLTALELLNLKNTGLTALPAGVFRGLTALQALVLENNALSSLPTDAFDGLASLTRLNLKKNSLSSLPEGVFADLTALNDLNLRNNALRSLPADTFLGLSSLTALNLQSNAVDPLPLPVTLEKVADGEFKAVMAVGAPFAVALPVSVSSSGKISGGATSLTIPAGATESGSLTVTRSAGATDAVTADIGALPSLPAKHQGYSLIKADVPVEVLVLPSADAALSALSLSDGTLNPAFAASTLSYTASVGAAVASVTVTPETNRDAATVEYLDGDDAALEDADAAAAGHQIALAAGANTVKVKVTAGDGTTTQTYTLEITRTAAEVTVMFSAAAYWATEGGPAAEVTVELSAAPQREVAVPIVAQATGGATAEGKTGADYSGVASSVTFGATDTAKSFTITATADDDAEDGESVSLSFGSLPHGVTSGDPATATVHLVDPCPRTAQICEAIIAAAGVTGWGAVTDTHLQGITALSISGLTALQSGDLAGLSGLTSLDLSDNSFSSLPSGLFDGLTALTTLDLSGNGLSRLPAGLFKGLTALAQVDVSGNTVEPLPLSVTLEKVADGQFKAVVATGAPAAVTLPIQVAGAGSIAGGATVTVPAGATESATATVTRTAGRTGAVAVAIGRPLPTLPEGHAGYALTADTGTLVVLPGTVTAVCDRTADVRDAIVAAVTEVSACVDVTAAHLSGITELDFSGGSLTALTLQSGDFSGLSGLQTLNLKSITLSSPPADLFDGLIALKKLNLQNTGLTGVSADLFDGLSSLEELILEKNQLDGIATDVFSGLASLTHLNLRKTRLSSVPSGLFGGLSQLQELKLRGNRLTTLPADVFSGLTALQTLNLTNNQLSAIPDGLFTGLTQLTSVRLDGNAGSPFSLTVKLETVGTDQFKAVLPAGAPFAIEVPVSVSGPGTIDGAATSVTITTGATESAPLTVTRRSGTTALVNADIGALPALPGSKHQGYALAKSADLPLAVLAEVAALPTLSVADPAEVKEGNTTITFTVTLTPAATGTVTVDYATADGTATAGEDYTTASGTLTFNAGDTAKTVVVTVLDDTVDEGKETFTLKLSKPSGATVSDGEATATIANSDPLPQAWLVRFGRTVAGHVADGVSERLMQADQAPSQATFAGVRLPFGDGLSSGPAEDYAPGPFGGRPWVGGTGWQDRGGGFGLERQGHPPTAGTPGTPAGASRGLTARDLLLGSAFTVALGRDEENAASRFTLWGHGMATRFEGGETDLRVDGEVATYLLGADRAWGRWLTGMAVAHSRGTGGYDALGGSESGELDSTLMSVHPYARYAISERMTAWGVLGYGQGSLTLNRQGSGTWNADTSITMAAAGARGVLRPAAYTGGFELALRSDALWTSIASGAAETDAGRLAASQGDAGRLRLVLEGARTWTSAGGRSLTPNVELGLRHDAGDAETGTGIELGAGMRYRDPAMGVSIEVKARSLIAHRNEAYREWGASAAVRFDPATPGRGLMLTLTPAWGNAASGAERLWTKQGLQSLTGYRNPDPTGRLNAEVSYALNGPKGRGTQTPYAALSLGDVGGRTLRVGWRLATGPRGNLNIEAMRRQTGRNDAAAEHGILLRAAVRW